MALSASPEVNVTVRAGSPLAEIFLIDHAFALVRRSVGDLQATVEPGVYKAKARLGDAETERLVMLDRDRDVDLSGDLHVASPAPLAGMREAEAGIEAARSLSAHVAENVGASAGIVLLTRGEGGGNAAEVSLHDMAGQPVAAADGQAGGTAYDLAPGPYLVRWRGRSGVDAEQVVHAVAEWQTQVFVVEQPGEAADLGQTRVSVLMGQGLFDPGDGELQLVEQARTALADERKVASDALTETLFAKFSNPMLGLFGAHLMLIGRDADDERPTRRRPRAPVQFTPERFEMVVHNLRALLGPAHPDVVALATQLHGHSLAALPPVTAPPMLWRSWVLLIEASNDAPALLPIETWRPAAAPLPLRPFLIWLRGGGGAEAHLAEIVARTLADSSDDEVRRALTRRLLIPRAAVDALAHSG